MNRVRAFVFEGQWFVPSMVAVVNRLNAIDGIQATHHAWNDYAAVQQAIVLQVNANPRVLLATVGFSLGGNTVAELARRMRHVNFGLGVAYDPSRLSPTARNRVEIIPPNLKRAVCYFNTGAWYWGGAYYSPEGGGQHVSNVQINEWHLKVPFREDLHERTESYFRELVQGHGLGTVRSGPN